MTVSRSGTRWLGCGLGLILALAVMAGVLVLTHPLWSDLLFNVTGEESLAGQVRGGLEWLGNITRRRPETVDLAPVANAGANPFGVNVFLEQEVEPEKREQAAQMIAGAGFHWLRQEFPWEDIEIHGKGDYQDRRHEPYRPAWDKYDHIVDLAERYDLEIIARLSNPPAWSRAEGDAAGAFAPPDNLDDYGEFVEAVVHRYKDRVRTYQIWNEPNIYPEWGDRPVSPEEYTDLLKVGYTRIKAVCPECIVLSGALAQTIPLGPRDLNDFIFLQRMYDAGAGEYFDVLAMQGYGLWSGPTDRRMRPRVLNFSRPLYLRELMVRNGDSDKPIWITEMNWNAPPPDFPDKQFGFVTPEQQARYAVLAYQRAQKEWPWLGVVNAWFFKRATGAEQNQAWYYFRLAEPDLAPLPVYQSLKDHMTSGEARVLYPGMYQEDHWALEYDGEWTPHFHPDAELGSDLTTPDSSQATLRFAFDGTDLALKTGPEVRGAIVYTIDGGPEQKMGIDPDRQVPLAEGLAGGRHEVTIRAASGLVSVDSLTIRSRLAYRPWLIAGVVALTGILIVVLILGAAARRRRWYERSRAIR